MLLFNSTFIIYLVIIRRLRITILLMVTYKDGSPVSHDRFCFRPAWFTPPVTPGPLSLFVILYNSYITVKNLKIKCNMERVTLTYLIVSKPYFLSIHIFWWLSDNIRNNYFYFGSLWSYESVLSIFGSRISVIIRRCYGKSRLISFEILEYF